MNAYQDLAVLDHRLGDVPESQDTPEVSIEPRAVHCLPSFAVVPITVPVLVPSFGWCPRQS
jgi:hypothetical protein